MTSAAWRRPYWTMAVRTMDWAIARPTKLLLTGESKNPIRVLLTFRKAENVSIALLTGMYNNETKDDASYKYNTYNVNPKRESRHTSKKQVPS